MRKHFKEESRLWDYTINKKLGKGTSGEVFQVINKTTHQVYALKKMPVAGTQQKQKIQAFKQIKCLSLLQHPSIIQYKESFLSMDNIYIVMEYASKGDFSYIIEDRRKKQRYYTEEQLWKLFQQIIKGVKYLHEKSIIHRDLKLQNIFMTEDGKVKIGDLGMAKILTKDYQLISTRVGTPVYFAPEMIQNQLYSLPVDVWALGCVLYNLATLEHPFQQASIQTLAYYAIEKGPKPIKGQYSLQLINFISSCLEKEVKNRPNIFQLAIKLKNRNKQQTKRYNKISIFNIKHLNKILNASSEPKVLAQTERKIKLQRQFSVDLSSPGKIYSSMHHRSKPDSVIQQRNIRSSLDNRDLFSNNYLIDSPQSPTLKKKFSKHDRQQNYRARKITGEQVQEIHDSFKQSFIKSNGFSLQIIQKNDSPKKIGEPCHFEPFEENNLLLKKAFSRRSHR